MTKKNVYKWNKIKLHHGNNFTIFQWLSYVGYLVSKSFIGLHTIYRNHTALLWLLVLRQQNHTKIKHVTFSMKRKSLPCQKSAPTYEKIIWLFFWLRKNPWKAPWKEKKELLIYDLKHTHQITKGVKYWSSKSHLLV